MWKNNLTPYHMEPNPINSLLYPLNPANISSQSSTVYTNCLSSSPMEHHRQIGGMPLHLPVGDITDQTDENHLQELILEPPDLVGDVFVGHFDRQTANGILVDKAVQDDLQVRSGQLGLFLDNCEIPRMDEVCGVAQESPVDMTGLQNFQHSQTSRHFAFPVEKYFESNPSTRSDAKNKIQMRWTTELHECFVHAVKDLGGPDRATPKAIVKHMKVNSLKIEHVKSHLQKYRDKCCRLCCDEDTRPSRLQGNKRSSAGKGSGTSVKFAKETDMLRLQLELQKGLHEQLLIQRQLQQLQVRSEENSQRLQMLLEEMKRLLDSHLITSTSSTMAQPSSEPLPVDNVVSAVDDDDGSTLGSELEFLLLSPKRMRLEAYESENYEVAE